MPPSAKTSDAERGEPLVTIDEVAAHISGTRQHVYEMNKRGLPRFMVGTKSRYRLSEVEAWLEKNRRRGDVPNPK